MRATRAVIKTGNLKHNLDAVRSMTDGSTKICLAVKADAYGHGAEGISAAAESYGVDYLAVAAISEARILRESGIRLPIILLGPALPEETEEAVAMKLEMVISSKKEFDRIIGASPEKKIAIHLKIDTGMGRIGCRPSDAEDLATHIDSSPSAELAGICTHFPVSDSCKPEDVEFTRKQIEVFDSAVQSIKARGIHTGLIHAANSGALLNYPEAHFDMVRPGIFAYGYLPGGREGLLRTIPENLMPKPVMSFESRLMHIKKVPAGTDISYGRTYKTETPSWIGTIPAGYADGYNRLLSNRGWVMIRGEKYRIAGTICMDQLMVDLGPDLKAELFDRVVLFGWEDAAPDAEDLTNMIGTIPYELICAVSKRVPRIFHK